MGREIPRNQNRRSQAPPNQYYEQTPQNGRDGGRNGYQRRGNHYEIGQSYRYMPNFEDERDSYFSRAYGGPQNARGNRGGFRGREN